jgi:hypothetical protein
MDGIKAIAARQHDNGLQSDGTQQQVKINTKQLGRANGTATQI